jgi:hypothetical protein
MKNFIERASILFLLSLHMPDTTSPKLLQMPGDDELYLTFLSAAQEGAHDRIKNIVKQIGGFLDKAKGEVKKILIFDPATGLSLHLNIQVGNDVLQGFVHDQNFLVRGTLQLLMASQGAQTFESFINKMKRTQEDIDVTRGTLTNILVLFFEKLGEKYVVHEDRDHIAQLVNALFGIS